MGARWREWEPGGVLETLMIARTKCALTSVEYLRDGFKSKLEIWLNECQ